MHLRDATPADLPVIADLIRALAEYERLTHEIEWTEDELAATLFGPEAVPRVVLAEPTDPPGPAVGLAVWFPTYSTFLGRPGIWLEDLFVLPDSRGGGVGTALL
ncbi:MAG TPA: GNAT family N-acetyltransferase, partial [Acidimicrobiia bacterium]|nr:GNAT family N-acetyltransferase [Acidimicrobiia bacterium]